MILRFRAGCGQQVAVHAANQILARAAGPLHRVSQFIANFLHIAPWLALFDDARGGAELKAGALGHAAIHGAGLELTREGAGGNRALQIAEAAKLKSKALRASRRRCDMVVSVAPAHAPSEAAE